MVASIGLICGAMAAADDDVGKILRPADHSSFECGEINVVATAPGGALQLDGVPLRAEQPFANVFHASVKPAPGLHTLILSWEGGKREVQFFVGANAPAGFEGFRQHPPVADVRCTRCHALNSRGRFAFKGGCFDCHEGAGFSKVHTHEVAVLEKCGLCHNAHGSVVKAHLLYPKETATKICHN